jgi:hypothetical protein
MYATVRHYEGVVDSEEVAKRVREGFVEPVDQPNRRVRRLLLRGCGRRSHGVHQRVREPVPREESNQLAAGWVKENIAELLPNPPTISAGHVVANT